MKILNYDHVIRFTGANMQIWMLNALKRMLQNEFECWNNGIAQSHTRCLLNWMIVLRTWCIFLRIYFEQHKFRFDWRQFKFEWWENKFEWRIGCVWPKSSKLNAHKMNIADKITKLTGKKPLLTTTQGIAYLYE